jgi:hypothetical protein
MSRMTYMRSWKSHRLTSHTWLGLNPQIGRFLSRIVGAIGFFGIFTAELTAYLLVCDTVTYWGAYSTRGKMLDFDRQLEFS